MDIILLEKIANLGDLGDHVTVKNGYARNFLIPQHKAVLATEEAVAKVQERRKELAKNAAGKLSGAKARADLSPKSIALIRLAGEEGRLFGSVQPVDIADALQAAGVEINRSEIAMPDGPIKQTGNFEVEVILHPEVRFNLGVSVAAEQEE